MNTSEEQLNLKSNHSKKITIPFSIARNSNSHVDHNYQENQATLLSEFEVKGCTTRANEVNTVDQHVDDSRDDSFTSTIELDFRESAVEAPEIPLDAQNKYKLRHRTNFSMVRNMVHHQKMLKMMKRRIKY